jgi:hypothetical protein
MIFSGKGLNETEEWLEPDAGEEERLPPAVEKQE